VLPPDKSPEVVIAEQDVWTYAVATAALLHEVGKALAAQRVLLQARGGVPIGRWGPWLGPMTATAATHYRIESADARDDQFRRAIAPLLVCHVVPRDGLTWLSQHPEALAAWLGAISEYTIGHSVITEIVTRAQDIVIARH
jgi:hypothetical protein